MNDIVPEFHDRFTDWYGFDTENDPTGKVTICALIHESGSHQVWREAGHLKKWCNRAEGKPVVICHNLEYDLVNEFGDDYCTLQLNYLKGRLISAKCGKVSFIDSFNHFRMSLEKLGEAVGIKKLEMDIESEQYVCTDALICLRAMTMARDYIASIGGQIGATSGSSAVSVWRHMTNDEYCSGALDTPWLRQGYYGGRVELFRSYAEGPMICNANGHIKYHKISRIEDITGKPQWWTKGESVLRLLEKRGQVTIDREPNIRGYDINSMYPYCMMAEYPEYTMNDGGMNKAKGMAEVTITIPTDLQLAPIPYRTPDGPLWYPVGRFRGVWTYDEIRFAEKCGGKVQKVHAGWGCNTLVRPFDEFIMTCYQKRKASKSEAERLFLKVLMNSLYGKLATKSEITRTVSRYTLEKNNSSRLHQVKWISYHRGLLDYQTPSPDYVNVLWGAIVTANARMLLTRYMMRVPPEKLIYCDTDSMYALDYELPESAELGGMKLEKRVEVMEVKQPKTYRLDDFYRAKGVPRPKYDKETGRILIDFAKQYMEDGSTQFLAPIRFRASLNSHRGKANQWVKHSKSMKTTYRAKRFANGRYYPPVVGEQMKLNL